MEPDNHRPWDPSEEEGSTTFPEPSSRLGLGCRGTLDLSLGLATYLEPTLSQVRLEIVEIGWIGGGGDEESDGGVGVGRGDLD